MTYDDEGEEMAKMVDEILRMIEEDTRLILIDDFIKYNNGQSQLDLFFFDSIVAMKYNDVKIHKIYSFKEKLLGWIKYGKWNGDIPLMTFRRWRLT